VSNHTTTSQPFYGPFFRDHQGEPVPEENFWTSWCKGRLTEADTLIIRLDATSSGLISDSPPSSAYFYAGCPSCRNPPNLSWLGTCTKYADLHTQWLGLSKYVSKAFIKHCSHLSVDKSEAVGVVKSRLKLMGFEMLLERIQGLG